MTRGKFIVLEGGEGSGKTSQAQALQQKLQSLDTKIKVTHEPGGTPIANLIRHLILSPELCEAGGKTQFGLFWAARADHLEKFIRPALHAGTHVLTDRFDSASYAYQIHGQEVHELKDLFFRMRSVYVGDTEPDAYIFLDVDPEIGLARALKRRAEDVNHFDERAVDFHRRIREGYLEFIAMYPHIIIDANRPFDVVANELLIAVRDIIGSGA
jgi:dTMP kinase